MPTTRAQSVRSSSRTASPEFQSYAESHSSQQSTSTPISQSHRNLRSSGQPAEHVDVEHIDVSHLSREARALLEDDLAHTPGSQGSPRLTRSSARSASATPSKTSARSSSKTRKGKPNSTRKIADISVTEDEEDHVARVQLVEPVVEIPSLSQDQRNAVLDDAEPVLVVEVEEWRSNLKLSNASQADVGGLTEQEGVSDVSNEARAQLDADTDSGSESDDSTASGGTARTATPRRYGLSSRAAVELEDEEDLDDMFQRALDQARGAAKVDEPGLEDDLQADVMMVGEKTVKERPIPGLSVPVIPRYDLEQSSTAQHRRQKDTGEGSSKGNGRATMASVTAKDIELERDTTAYQPEISRKQKMKQPKPHSANEAWAALPPIPSSILPQMRRDYQAMNLANSLDPKRFMKGGAKSTKIPENFAIGTIINPPKKLQSTTLTKERKYNPGSIVQTLVADSELGSYAKRKYNDFAGSRMANGRGQGWKKRKGEDW
ncbi:hypothetical protein QFC22_004628 [Naganishia vaughanmartiniae]|uniref:Uncharacterized protein n=1 Tax=Naganishia vaughanmartiniae TaxID=1424756 RepID=A0ACC2X0P6_9TREE|nr:hypothetical protein QFC22_004628 [Naganishia vaughanmartiniae]